MSSLKDAWRAILLTFAASIAGLIASLLAGPDGIGLPADPAAARLVFVEIRVPRG